MPDRPVVTHSVIIDGSLEGLLTTVYSYYYEKLRPSGMQDGSLPSFQQRLGEEYIYVKTDPERAAKVYEAMEHKFSHDTMSRIHGAAAHIDKNRFYDLFRYILLAFKEPERVDMYEGFDYVLNVHQLAKGVYMEAHLLKGFTRFRKSGEGILYAEIEPKHDGLWFICEHFCDRLGGERWIIHDAGRGKAGVFDCSECVIVPVPQGLKAGFAEDEREREFQKLWTAFYKTIGIQERANSKLRRQNSPKYFWKHMTEHRPDLGN
ncbi:MAG: TIGR03915 family putative DNA repair protein [Clostridiales bacterium]|jgi:probable DNA metabolism protein|nr:TIGR03915 family putative DNA repair protein [Clostridiales bacterium]